MHSSYVYRQLVRGVGIDIASPIQLSLFCADVLQALGAVVDVHWVHVGYVETSGLCTTQGSWLPV